MTRIKIERHGYGTAFARLGASETAEQAASRLRALYPDARALVLVVSSPYGARVERFL